MKTYTGKIYTGEREFFRAKDAAISGCTVEGGESPFKHSENVRADGCVIRSKYPFWYSRGVGIVSSTFEETARAGIWYTDGVEVRDTKIDAPKTFRRCRGITLENVAIPNAEETFWQCENVRLKNAEAKGDYLFMNCSGVEADGLVIEGKYAFDGAKGVVVRNSRLITKDAFWNTEDVTVYDSFISSEYVGWNSKNVTLVRCTVESLQGFCYIEGLRLVDCALPGTTLAFEYSSVDADVKGEIPSVLDPASGVIRAGRIGKLTVRERFVDPAATRIECGDIGETTDEPEF